MSERPVTEQERRTASKACEELQHIYTGLRGENDRKAKALDAIIARLEQWMRP